MASDIPLDYAVFQLSPRRSRCELFVTYDDTTEKIASGLVKPFVTHLKVAEDQVALAVKSIKLEVERYKNAESWFTKGTLERFVRFVSTPEVLEMVNTLDAEMSQLEAARKIYSQGAGINQSTGSGGDGAGATTASDATKKELLRAIDVRLSTVKQDLAAACTRGSAAGFNPDTVSELQQFADRFGAHRLSEACGKFIGLSQRRSDLFSNMPWKSSSDQVLRSSTGSDMSLDDLCDEQLKVSGCQQPSTTKATFPLRRFSREPSPSPVDEVADREHKEKDIDQASGSGGSTTTTTTMTSESEPSTQSSQKPQLTRRLSVQERINLFESKQKESSPSSTTPSSASTGVKPELRRLSSDVNSSSEKAVWRRWSGVSDMSIDVSVERKEPESNATTPTTTPTPTSAPFPIIPPRCKDQGELMAEEADKSKDKDSKDSKLPARAKVGASLTVFSSGGSVVEEPASSDASTKIPSFSGRDNAGMKDQPPYGGRVRSRTVSIGGADDFYLDSQSTPVQAQSRPRYEKYELSCSTKEISSEDKLKGPGGGTKEQQREDQNEGLKDQWVSAAESQSQPLIQNKEGEADTMLSQPRLKSVGGEVGKGEKINFESFEKQGDISAMRFKSSSSLTPKFQGQSPVAEQMRKIGGGREEGGSRHTSSLPVFSGKNVVDNQEPYLPSSAVPTDQNQRIRQSKGIPGLNDDLKLKANELEKLFAEHKLRIPGDQSNSARRTRPIENPRELEGSSSNKKSYIEASPAQLTVMKMEVEPATKSNDMEAFNATPIMKKVDTQDYDVTPNHNVYSLGFSDDSRGKLYQKYMQKRDAKLKEDWSSRGAEKEAKLKAMQETLENSRVEVKAKLAMSADKRNSVHDSSRRAEKIRSFNVRSAVKGEKPVDSFISDDDVDQAEFVGKKLSETYLGDNSSKSAQSKKLPNKNMASSTPRNSTLPVHRSAGKASNSAAGRRRLNSDNPLAQSVPNFADLRKENTKPSSAGSKPARLQGRNHARKKSINDDMLLNEEKPRRSQSLRKNVAGPLELNDSRNSDEGGDTGFMASKFEKDDDEDYDKVSKGMGSKFLPSKGSIGRLKGSDMVEAVRNGHIYDDASLETEEMSGMVKAVDDYETTLGVESADMVNGKGRLSHESDKSENYVYESSDPLRFSEADPGSASELPMPSLFRTMGSLQDSPGESPVSWNARVQNAFSFANDISDIDASDSPIGSPASWNFHTLGQSDAEAARMRKKWGAAQKPIVGVDSSHSQSRKDITKGIKRFLKFGRKNRASESLADWVSATTSEGDDDTEDGRDPVYRTSEDLRKSRMGFSHSNHSDDGFNESEVFTEQAPKSFFSLSNFRSKGSESKLR